MEPHFNKQFIKDLLTKNDIENAIRENLDNLISIIPEIKPMIGFDHKNPYHHLDVFEHTLLTLSLSPNNFDVRLILLLHDIGKPYSFTEGEVRHFKGHPIVSANMSRVILNRLGFDNDYINKICEIIQEHDNAMHKKYIMKNKEMSIIRFNVQICDALAHNPKMNEKRLSYIEEIKQKFKELEINPSLS